MKTKLLLFLFLFKIEYIYSQSDCGCAAYETSLKNPSKSFYDGEEAQKIVDGYCQLFEHTLPVKVSEMACKGVSTKNLIYAVVCPIGREKHHVIFYQNSFMNKLISKNSVGDHFLLAHEVAHHILGHTDAGIRTQTKDGSQPLKVLEEAIGSKLSRFSMAQLDEIAADMMGLWLAVRKKSLSTVQIEIIFDVMIDLYYAESLKNSSAGNTKNLQISLAARKAVLKESIDRLHKDQAFNRMFTAQNLEDIRQKINEETYRAYAFVLVNMKDSEAQELEETEQKLRKALLKLSGISISPMVGRNSYFPVVKRDGRLLDAHLHPEYLLGFRLWPSSSLTKHSFGADFFWTRTRLETRIDVNEKRQVLEKLNTDWLYIRPRYEYNWIRNSRRRSVKFGTSLGIATSIPLKTTYLNYRVTEPSPPKIGLSVSPAAGLGYSLSTRLDRRRFHTLLISYEPKKINASAFSDTKTSVSVHTFSMNLIINIANL